MVDIMDNLGLFLMGITLIVLMILGVLGLIMFTVFVAYDMWKEIRDV